MSGSPYPYLGRWRARRFGFGDIDSVEVKEVGRGGKQVRIVLLDGYCVVYRTCNERAVDELVEALRRGVAEAKPRLIDWDELA